VQNSRKEMGLLVTDRIRLTVFGPEKLKQAWDSLGASVAEETLAIQTVWAKAEGQIPLEAGDETWMVKIEKNRNEE